MDTPISQQRAVGICLVLGSILVLVALWDMPRGLRVETRSKVQNPALMLRERAEVSSIRKSW